MEMAMRRWLVVCVVLVGRAAALCAEPAEGGWDAAARLLAGMPGPGFEGLRARAAWPHHAVEMDKTWARFEGGRMPKIRAWSASELGDVHGRCGAVFYPFSGPDLVHAVAFFPKADTYVLCALEKAEPLPALTSLGAGEWAAALEAFRPPLETALNFTYFITKDMRRDFEKSALRGVLPPLLALAARMEFTVRDVEPVQLGAGGEVAARPEWGPAAIAGVRMDLRSRRGGGAKKVYFFTADLGDGALGEDSRLLRFLDGLGPRAAFVKSASYLMHESYFSRVRAALLDGCDAILQDDSGIPVAGFDAARWDVRLYGNYQGTLDMFRQYYQPALRAMFEAGGARPLTFGVGYRFKPDDTVLILGRRRAPR